MITNNHLHHSNEHYHNLVGIIPPFLFTLLFVIALIMYCLAVLITNRRYKSWPIYRTVCWIFGTLFSIVAVAPPLVNDAHSYFTTHMIVHLLLGMLAPLLMTLAAPMTLALRTLPIPLARRLALLLKSWPSQMLTHPIVASLLNIGGLWLLYTTNLYSLMHESTILHLIAHLHVFLAGYLFTVSMIYIDPTPHRVPFLHRATVFVVALAGHDMLAKYIYAHPPAGVLSKQAEAGSMLMYYGGDIIDAVIIFILCLQWFRAVQPRTIPTMSH